MPSTIVVDDGRTCLMMQQVLQVQNNMTLCHGFTSGSCSGE